MAPRTEVSPAASAAATRWTNAARRSTGSRAETAISWASSASARSDNDVIGNVHRGRSWRYANRGPPRVSGRSRSSSAASSRSSSQAYLDGRHPRRLLRVGLADTIRVAAELPAAFAHAPPGPLAVVQMLGFVGEIVGLPGPEMPRPGRQVELTHPPPLGGADKTPSPPTARVADCGEGNFVIDVAPLAGPFVDDGATHPDPAVRAVAGRHLEGDGESVVVVGARTSSCRQRGRHPGWRRPGPGAGCRARTWFRPERDRRFAWACITKS